jgi:hypothetical protein
VTGPPLVGDATTGNTTDWVAVATTGVFVLCTATVGVLCAASWVRFASTVCAAAVNTVPGPCGSSVLAGRLQALKVRERSKIMERYRDKFDIFLCYS